MTPAAAAVDPLAAARLSPVAQHAVAEFQAFYRVLVDIRQEVVGSVPVESDAVDDESAPRALRGTPSPADVRRTLAEAIGRYGDATAGKAVETGYVMASVADEMLLVQCPHWPGREAWVRRPLEHTLYGTRIAGERIFEAAQSIILGQNDDSALAAVILLAFELGFRGRYSGIDDHGEIERCRKGLFKALFKTDYAEELSPPPASRLSQPRLEGASVRRLPALWPWLAAIPALLLAYLPISHAVWLLEVHGVLDLARKIIDTPDVLRP